MIWARPYQALTWNLSFYLHGHYTSFVANSHCWHQRIHPGLLVSHHGFLRTPAPDIVLVDHGGDFTGRWSPCQSSQFLLVSGRTQMLIQAVASLDSGLIYKNQLAALSGDLYLTYLQYSTKIFQPRHFTYATLLDPFAKHSIYPALNHQQEPK